MGLTESTPQKGLLPNGKPAPRLCTVCGTESTKCVCPPPPAEPAMPMVVPNDAASGSLPVVPDLPVDLMAALNKQCSKCGSELQSCICAATIGQREAKIRQTQLVAFRIEGMVDFCSALHQHVPPGNETQDRFEMLMARGRVIGEQHDVLQEFMKKGVITGEIMQKHLEEVDKWLKDCDDFNAIMCSTALSSATPLPMPTVPTADVK